MNDTIGSCFMEHLKMVNRLLRPTMRMALVSVMFGLHNTYAGVIIENEKRPSDRDVEYLNTRLPSSDYGFRAYLGDGKEFTLHFTQKKVISRFPLSWKYSVSYLQKMERVKTMGRITFKSGLPIKSNFSLSPFLVTQEKIEFVHVQQGCNK